MRTFFLKQGLVVNNRILENAKYVTAGAKSSTYQGVEYAILQLSEQCSDTEEIIVLRDSNINEKYIVAVERDTQLDAEQFEFQENDHVKKFEEKLDQEDMQEYRNKYRAAFESRHEASWGDGICYGLNDFSHKTVEIELYGQKYYFSMLTSGGGSWTNIYPASRLNDPEFADKNKDIDVEDHFTLAEQLYLFQQLLCNPWIESPDSSV